jgi:hypothetical protein
MTILGWLWGWVVANPRAVAIAGTLTLLSFTRAGRWTWRHWWWPLMCAVGRAMLPDASRYTSGKLDRRRFFTDVEKAHSLARYGPRCRCAGGCGSSTHRYHGQCEVIHLDGQRLVGGHIEAHARGGRTNAKNLAMVCHDCNTAWGDRPMAVAAGRRRWRLARMVGAPERSWR